MPTKQLLFWLFLIASNLDLRAQLAKDIFPLNRQYKSHGFYIQPSLNYLLPLGEKSEKIDIKDTLNTNYQFDVKGTGKFSYGIEIGGFYTFKERRFIQWIELGLGYRNFKGGAEHKGTFSNDTSQFIYKSDNTLDVPMIVGAIRAKNIHQLGKLSFMSHAIGVNVNYLFSEKYIRSSPYQQRHEKFPATFNIQVHYELGVGFKVSDQLLIIPSLETPILAAYPIDEIRSGFQFFSAEYQPLIFKIGFAWLLKDPENCNAPTYNGPLSLR